MNRTTPDLIASAGSFCSLGGWTDLTASLPLGGVSNAQRVVEALKKLLDQGAPLDHITISSDGNVTLPRRNANDEVIGKQSVDVSTLANAWREVVIDSGLPFQQALSLVTSNPASGLGLAGRKGLIVPGADADLVAWDSNLNPHIVVVGGKVHHVGERPDIRNSTG